MRSRERQGGYARYLLENERLLFAIHRHPMILARPVALLLGASTFTLAVVLFLPPTLSASADLLVWATAAVGLYLLWQIVEWRKEWFVATDKRLLLTQGLLSRNAGTMPLAKVTDLSYQRSLAGRALGYGTFVFESAGQDQAMRRVDWIPKPDTIYRLVCADMFSLHPNADDRSHMIEGHASAVEVRWAEADPHGSDSAGERPGSTRYPVDPDAPAAPVEHHNAHDHSRAIPIRPANGGPNGPVLESSDGRTGRGKKVPEVLFESPDIVARRRAAQTGPIRYFPTDDPDHD
ncbi:MAG: PH domain-containing protein [Candidatus Phosphoribacter sp.]|nr:PH domain-containing protein [Actinomycetales bacterium]